MRNFKQLKIWQRGFEIAVSALRLTSTFPKEEKHGLESQINRSAVSIPSNIAEGSSNLKSTVVENATGTNRIPVEDIETNPKQPRRDFDEQTLKELAESIRIHDIIQPVTVSKLPSGKFRLITGERRWRAAKMAGIKDIPAYVRQANDAQLLELALLENLQREDLNAIEISLSYKRMMEELSYTP